ncbi:MAG: hypothetical protein H0U76_10260, partial [Ktedonobacteraceae bacterium]|nr:hypothetical protein [Ktedonobacteraceae bacterium]
AYRDALEAGLGVLASYNLGLLLERQPERAEEAEQWYRRYQITLETGYSNTYLRPAPFSGEQHLHGTEVAWALHMAIHAEEKSASYSSFDNQTFKARVDGPVPHNRSLYSAYRRLLGEFGQALQNTEDES